MKKSLEPRQSMLSCLALFPEPGDTGLGLTFGFPEGDATQISDGTYGSTGLAKPFLLDSLADHDLVTSSDDGHLVIQFLGFQKCGCCPNRR